MQPPDLLGPLQGGPALLGKPQVVHGMRLTGHLALPRVVERLQPKLAQHLQHPKPDFAPGLFLLP